MSIPQLSRDDLFSLEKYAEVRADFRSKVLAHKQHRQVAIGPFATLYFEDRLTMQYQIQEMLRVERIYEAAGIQEELDAYNPLIPDGSNWKATFMVEVPDPDERRTVLAKLVGVEDKVWVSVGEHAPVFAIADEDMERTTADKTSAVHFLRFDMDSGPILGQAAVPVLPNDTAESLAARVLAAEHRLYPLCLRLLAEGRVTVEGESARVAGNPPLLGPLLNPAPAEDLPPAPSRAK